MLAESVSQESCVQPAGTLELRQHQPHEEDQVDDVPVGHESQDKAKEGIEEGHATVNHPVCEPCLFILFFAFLDGADRVQSRVDNGDEGHDNLPPIEKCYYDGGKGHDHGKDES